MSLKLTGKDNKVTLESDINDGPRSSLPRDLPFTTNGCSLLPTNAQKDANSGRWPIDPRPHR